MAAWRQRKARRGPSHATVRESAAVRLARVMRFALVGLANTGVDLFVLNVLTLATGITDGVGFGVQKTFSFLVAVVGSYLLNKHWTFRDQSRRTTAQLYRFVAVSVVGALLNVLTASMTVTYAKPALPLFVDLGALRDQLWVNIGALSGTAAGLSWNYLGYRNLVFTSKSTRDVPRAADFGKG